LNHLLHRATEIDVQKIRALLLNQMRDLDKIVGIVPKQLQTYQSTGVFMNLYHPAGFFRIEHQPLGRNQFGHQNARPHFIHQLPVADIGNAGHRCHPIGVADAIDQTPVFRRSVRSVRFFFINQCITVHCHPLNLKFKTPPLRVSIKSLDDRWCPVYQPLNFRWHPNSPENVPARGPEDRSRRLFR